MQYRSRADRYRGPKSNRRLLPHRAGKEAKPGKAAIAARGIARRAGIIGGPILSVRTTRRRFRRPSAVLGGQVYRQRLKAERPAGSPLGAKGRWAAAIYSGPGAHRVVFGVEQLCQAGWRSVRDCLCPTLAAAI